MKKYISVGLLSLASLASLEAQANPWAECGIGSVIFEDNRAASAISNIIWDLGTTAITSAISSEGTCKGKKLKTALFINQTYPNLEEETAIGSGPYVVAMLDTLGCNANAQGEIIRSIRQSYAKSAMSSDFNTMTRNEKAENYYNIVIEKTQSTCSSI